MKTCTFCSANYPDEYLYCPRDQKPLVDPSDLAPGSIIRHKYEIIGEAGQDGTSVLYRGRHLLFGTDLILKVARAEMMSRGGRERFFADARRAWEMGETRRPRVIDIDETELGRPFLVMESAGGDFADASAVSPEAVPEERRSTDRRAKFVPQTQTLRGAPKVADRPGDPTYKKPLDSDRRLTRSALLWSTAVLAIIGVGVILLAIAFRTPGPGTGPTTTASIAKQDSQPQPRTTLPAVTEPAPEEPVQASPTAQPPAQSVLVPPASVVAKVDTARVAESARVDSKSEIARAQVRLGQMHEEGLGVTQDDEQAALWYRRAAEAGYAPAQNSLGRLYDSGRGVPRDNVEAADWYRKAANQGFAAAQNNLANAYALGKGVPKNDARAVAWYRKAADQGYVVAQANLGWVYQNGRGVLKSESQALTWYRKAADQGYAPAQSNLADMYEKGGSTARNFTQAVQWYLKAAEQGYAPAQSKLGLIYEAGQGVEKSLDQAVAWYKKAAAQGYADARKALERLGVPDAEL